MGLAEIDVTLNADGTGTVRLNGEDVSHQVRSVRVEGGLDENGRRYLPQATLVLGAAATVTGVASVTSEAPAPEAVAEALDDLLASVDPELLDQEVLEGLGLGEGEGSTGARYVAALRGFIRGD